MTKKHIDRKNPASFRDPDGFVFSRDSLLHRQINHGYRESYELLMGSGLYHVLTRDDSLVPHEEIGSDAGAQGACHQVIRPELIPFISYPYEWCFSQLRDAALKTLEVQAIALEHGMILKDASAFNIQFKDSRPIHIDTLSFAIYEEGRPWDAYGQFCRHFLAPLALMSRQDARLGSLSRVFLDGVPLDLASSLLSWASFLNPGLMMHVHMHSRSQRSYSGKARSSEGLKLGKRGLQGIVQSLRNTVEKLTWKNPGTEWGEYYRDTNYTEKAAASKTAIIRNMLERTDPKACWDLGSNNGLYSRIASDMGIPTIAFDLDHGAVESGYLDSRSRNAKNILTLLLDLANPSPALGWNHSERSSLLDRGPVDMCMALALIHHLAFSNNLPFDEMADFFARAGKFLILEFVPKSDGQAKRLLASRKDIFADYHEERFIQAFSRKFEILERHAIPESERTLFLMKSLEL